MTNEKVVIITGGGQGIGKECALHLLAKNWHVVIADLNIKSLDFSFDESRLLLVKTDVKRKTSVQNMIQRTVKHFGRIDALVNNAGLLPNADTSLEKTSLKVWNDFIHTNLTGAFLCSKYAVSHLRKQKGSIINVASTRALQSEGDDVPYSASKGGLVALTHALAVDLGPNIRVNCISPGWINSHNEHLKKKDHQQHPVGRVGNPEDIAHMLEFLISDQATFITGQNFVVDGGMTIKMIYN
jgi:NAD(P)-dependent dehydrogenase (short-subunit alcohol dehydrogenase family)